MRWPGRIPANAWTGELFTSEDWLPTLLAAAGDDRVKEDLLEGRSVGDQKFKVHLDGYNQLALLTAREPSKRRESFY